MHYKPGNQLNQWIFSGQPLWPAQGPQQSQCDCMRTSLRTHVLRSSGEKCEVQRVNEMAVKGWNLVPELEWIRFIRRTSKRFPCGLLTDLDDFAWRALQPWVRRLETSWKHWRQTHAKNWARNPEGTMHHWAAHTIVFAVEVPDANLELKRCGKHTRCQNMCWKLKDVESMTFSQVVGQLSSHVFRKFFLHFRRTSQRIPFSEHLGCSSTHDVTIIFIEIVKAMYKRFRCPRFNLNGVDFLHWTGRPQRVMHCYLHLWSFCLRHTAAGYRGKRQPGL